MKGDRTERDSNQYEVNAGGGSKLRACIQGEESLSTVRYLQLFSMRHINSSKCSMLRLRTHIFP